jgi:hypothetical protein
MSDALFAVRQPRASSSLRTRIRRQQGHDGVAIALVVA